MKKNLLIELAGRGFSLSVSASILLSASGALAAVKPASMKISAATDPSDNVALSRPNAISVELLGRGGLYSLNYDRSISDSFAVGAGISYWSISLFGETDWVAFLPIYGNYYFSPSSSRGFMTAGVDLAIASGTGMDKSSLNAVGGGFAAVVGGGYEYRGTGGFLFRAAPYLLIGRGVSPWFGLSFGSDF